MCVIGLCNRIVACVSVLLENENNKDFIQFAENKIV